ncbi:MAG TPA: hypothetical protein ENN60_03860 [archaeon]|nr:hypothetical protein [archaeon]
MSEEGPDFEGLREVYFGFAEDLVRQMARDFQKTAEEEMKVSALGVVDSLNMIDDLFEIPSEVYFERLKKGSQLIKTLNDPKARPKTVAEGLNELSVYYETHVPEKYESQTAREAYLDFSEKVITYLMDNLDPGVGYQKWAKRSHSLLLGLYQINSYLENSHDLLQSERKIIDTLLKNACQVLESYEWDNQKINDFSEGLKNTLEIIKKFNYGVSTQSLV